MNFAATALKNNGGCFAEVSSYGGDSWLSVVEISKGNDDGTFISDTVYPTGADNNPDLRLRIRATGRGNGGYCYADNVIVSGAPGAAN
jgi:hypothetical protein